MRTTTTLPSLALAALVLSGCTAAPAIDESKLVDLTYPFNEDTIYWPTAQKFTLDQVAFGPTPGGYFYASNDFCASEHGGTHLDAPIHFAEGRRDAADVPVTQLFGPARVIDIRAACDTDPNYVLSRADVERHEREHGPIEPGTIVLVHTGWGRFYPDAKRYLGSEVRGVVEDLSFPGIGADGAEALVERRIDVVGIDTASLDHGPSRDFIAHQILNGADIPGLENVANLERLPPKGAYLIALPVKIEGGSGGPCRIVAILP